MKYTKEELDAAKEHLKTVKYDHDFNELDEPRTIPFEICDAAAKSFLHLSKFKYANMVIHADTLREMQTYPLTGE